MNEFRSALIVGAGDGLSASLARLLAAEGHAGRARRAQCRQAARARARRPAPSTAACDAAGRRAGGEPVRHHGRAAGRAARRRRLQCQRPARGPLVELDPAAVAAGAAGRRVRRLPGGAAGGAADAAAGPGAILFTGASASVKGYALSAPFAMGKFALRGLAQSMARELAPQGIHVAHFVIDGAHPQSGPHRVADSPTPCSIPTRSPRPTCTSSAGCAAPGPGRSSCGPGWRRSEPASLSAGGRARPRSLRRQRRAARLWMGLAPIWRPSSCSGSSARSGPPPLPAAGALGGPVKRDQHHGRFPARSRGANAMIAAAACGVSAAASAM